MFESIECRSCRERWKMRIFIEKTCRSWTANSKKWRRHKNWRRLQFTMFLLLLLFCCEVGRVNCKNWLAACGCDTWHVHNANCEWKKNRFSHLVTLFRRSVVAPVSPWLHVRVAHPSWVQLKLKTKINWLEHFMHFLTADCRLHRLKMRWKS